MHAGVSPFHTSDRLGTNEDFLAGQPVAGIRHQKTNFPVCIVNDKIVYVADFTVGGMDMVADDLPGAAQMRVIPSL